MLFANSKVICLWAWAYIDKRRIHPDYECPNVHTRIGKTLMGRLKKIDFNNCSLKWTQCWFYARLLLLRCRPSLYMLVPGILLANTIKSPRVRAMRKIIARQFNSVESMGNYSIWRTDFGRRQGCAQIMCGRNRLEMRQWCDGGKFRLIQCERAVPQYNTGSQAQSRCSRELYGTQKRRKLQPKIRNVISKPARMRIVIYSDRGNGVRVRLY